MLYYASDSLSTEAVHDAGYVNIDTLKPVASATAASTAPSPDASVEMFMYVLCCLGCLKVGRRGRC